MKIGKQNSYLQMELRARGWNVRLIDQWLGEPDHVRRRYGGGEYHYYLHQRVHQAEQHSEWQAASTKIRERQLKLAVSRTPEGQRKRRLQLAEKFQRKYGDPFNALPDAAFAMFNLNRYAKHSNCSCQTKTEIYELKHELVRILTVYGFLVGAQVHTRPARHCFSCNGVGKSAAEPCFDLEEADYHQEDESCHRCGGNGEYHPSSNLLLLSFEIAGTTYSWHVPEEEITFSFQLTAPAIPWREVPSLRPLVMTARKALASKALIRWVIEAERKRTDVREKVYNNLVFLLPAHREHGESLHDKLTRLGDADPARSVLEIRTGRRSAIEFFAELNKRKKDRFREKIRKQLETPYPRHRHHGLPLEKKLFTFVRKGVPFRRQQAQQAAEAIRNGSLPYESAVSQLEAGTFPLLENRLMPNWMTPLHKQ